METSVFSVKEFLANCNGSNCYDAVEELNVSFQNLPTALCPIVTCLHSPTLRMYSTY